MFGVPPNTSFAIGNIHRDNLLWGILLHFKCMSFKTIAGGFNGAC